MAEINTKRVLLGTVAGWIVWLGVSYFTNGVWLAPRYVSGVEIGWFLREPRYGFFMGYWAIVLLLLSYACAWIYAAARDNLGPGPLTALRIGLMVGFVAGFPVNFSLASWSVMDRVFPLWWMLELWVGAILATFVAGWLYKET
jgi:hypothetical protein